MVRTTLILDDIQMMNLRKLAKAQNRTITALINEFVAEGLTNRTQKNLKRKIVLPSFDMGKPRVNLADRAALEAIME
jgi:hypothetical protein